MLSSSISSTISFHLCGAIHSVLQRTDNLPGDDVVLVENRLVTGVHDLSFPRNFVFQESR